MNTLHKPKGFIALISALIISSVMLLIATGGSLAGFYTRVTSLNSEYKERSFFLADTCVNQTLLTLAGTPTYTGSATTSVSGSIQGACYTGPITKAGVAPNDTYQFRVRSYYMEAYSSIAVTAKVSDLSITTYTEVPVY
jgi:hypothetical protein